MYMRNNKGHMMEPAGTSYLMVWISIFLIDDCILSSVAEIAFEPMKSYSSDAVMDQFRKKNIEIDSLEDFLQVYEDTTGKVVIVKSISYHFCEAYKRMIS